MVQRMFQSRIRSIKQHPKLGYLLYASGVQYFFVQVIVASRWTPTFNLSRNTISDLGNTACGSFNARFVCSPWHTLMNLSFILLGIAMMVGSLLTYSYFKQNRKTSIGFSAFGIGGLGVILVGLFPENSISVLHGIGAALPFSIGNLGILILGFALKDIPKWLRVFTIFTGIVALTALVFYANNNFLKLGEGGIERVVAYPQTIWLVVFGLYGIYITWGQNFLTEID